MSAESPTPPRGRPDDEALRPHAYDGIQEYDKRLPNWWLFTLYGAIAFAVVYWFYYHRSSAGLSDREIFKREMDAVQAARLANAVGELSDLQLWEMSRNGMVVAAGRTTFSQNCVPCHLASLRGRDESPLAQGPNLTDEIWLHGARPNDLRRTVTQGVTTATAQMPPWGPVLGEKKIIEVVAYVLSHHQPPAPGTEAAAP